MTEGKVKVLVVDDEEHIRKLLQRVLEEAGYNVLMADSGQEALDKLVQSKNQGPQLILLDIKMPGKSGIELLSEIKTSYPDTAVVMVTATSDVNIAIRCMKEGAYDYVLKPFNPEEVVLTVNRALEKRSLELENKDYRQHLEDKVAEQAEKIRTAFFNAITALAYALEAKDKYTSGHSQKVADISVVVAKEMGLPQESIDKVRLAGLLHDIGKIGVMEAVLNKPSRLTDEEFQHVQKHSEIGEHILAPVADDQEILRMVRNHHEHYDGTGYPDGLKGDRIPLGARILAVADAYAAMTSERPYRKATDITTAIGELERGCGTQFDVEAVAAFLSGNKKR